MVSVCGYKRKLDDPGISALAKTACKLSEGNSECDQNKYTVAIFPLKDDEKGNQSNTQYALALSHGNGEGFSSIVAEAASDDELFVRETKRSGKSPKSPEVCTELEQEYQKASGGPRRVLGMCWGSLRR